MKIYPHIAFAILITGVIGCSKPDPQVEFENTVKNLPRNSIGSLVLTP